MTVSEYHPSEIPAKPGVYVFRDRFGEVIYVGKARNLRRRLANYFQPARKRTADAKLRSLIHSIAEWNYELVHTEDEALILESRLIKDYAPHYNILMRDDKRYLLLKIDWSDRFPTLQLARLKKPDHASYFGPFPNGTALKSTREYLLMRFGLRGCREAEPNEETRKHCLKRLVKDCCAPCTGQITQEAYRARLDAALAVLEGDISGLRNELQQKMSEAALAEQFEKAARLRDIADNLEAVFGRKSRTFERAALPGSPGGMQAVAALQNRLGLQKPPKCVIGFDISNILGTLAVASLVCFTDGKPDRDRYRRFRIKTVGQSDDFAMMAEVIRRHFGRLLEEHRELPDLVMVDGGKGQLSSAVAALFEINCPPIPIIGLAKRNEEIYLPGRSDPVVLDRHDPALRMLQALRDEAHRFAITYHRALRDRRIEHSMLDDLPGIGAVRKRQLLKKFGSARRLADADPALIAVCAPGLGLEGARKLRDKLAARFRGTQT